MLCQTAPWRLIAFGDDKKGIAEFNGIKKEIDLRLIKKPKIGDFFVLEKDFATKIVSRNEADSIIGIWEDQFQKNPWRWVEDKIKNEEKLGRWEVEFLLGLSDKKELQKFFDLANATRRKYVGSQVCIHGIIEFSNFCRMNCGYCGLRRDNKNLTRYRMTEKEIIDLAGYAVNKLGYKMLVLQSGEDLWYSQDRLLKIIKGIKEKSPKALLFLSVGERDRETYEKLYQAGACGVLFRFETSNKNLYRKLHPGASYEKRMSHLKFMKEIGCLIASGPLIGLPGQTTADLAKDILTMRELGVTMASMGPFIPHVATPLKNYSHCDYNLALKMIAAARLAYPRVRIPVTTALEVISGNRGRETALQAGGNSFMLNLTPDNFRKNYGIYPGKTTLNGHSHSPAAIDNLKKIIERNKMRICKGWGGDYTLSPEKFDFGCR